MHLKYLPAFSASLIMSTVCALNFTACAQAATLPACAHANEADYAACLIGRSETCAHQVMQQVRPDYRPRMPLYTNHDTSVEAGTSEHLTRLTVRADDITGKIALTVTDDHLAFQDNGGRAIIVGGTKALIKSQDIFSYQTPITFSAQRGISPIAEEAAYANAIKAYDLYQGCMSVATSGPMCRYTSQFPARFSIDKLNVR